MKRTLITLTAIVLLASCGNDTKRMAFIQKKFPYCKVSKEQNAIILTYPTGHKSRVSFDTFNDTIFYLNRY